MCHGFSGNPIFYGTLELDSVALIFAKKQLDGPVHDLRLRCALAQLLRRFLCHVTKANQQGIQGFGDLARMRRVRPRMPRKTPSIF